MLRRLLNAFLLVAGAGPIGWALASRDFDVRRSVGIGFLLLVGVGLNLTGLIRRSVPLRPWLRVLGVLVSLAVLGGVLAIRRFAGETLDSLSETNIVLREPLAKAQSGLLWLALATVYVGASVVLLPGCPAASCAGGDDSKSEPDASEPGEDLKEV
jgi:hypothetical protein